MVLEPASMRPFHRVVAARPGLLDAVAHIEDLLWDDGALPPTLTERIRIASAEALACPY